MGRRKGSNPPNLLDLVGQVFGRLTVLRRAGADSQGRALWECACSCGGRKVTHGAALRRGECLSCGCLRRDRQRQGMRRDCGRCGWPFWAIGGAAGQSCCPACRP